MRKIFVSAAVTAALCSLAISVTPALGHAFYGDRTSSVIANSSTPQIFWLGGTSNWVECDNLEMKFTPETTESSKLKLKMENYTSCVYNYNATSHPLKESTKKCVVVLKSGGLEETIAHEFGEGFVNVECELRFITISGCEAKFKEPTGALPEFEWRDKDLVYGSYESLLVFRLEKMDYTSAPVSEKLTGCETSGTNGEYDGSIPLDDVIVK